MHLYYRDSFVSKHIKVFFLLVFSFLFFSINTICFADPVYHGERPDWMVGPENDLVGNMRKLGAYGLGAYIPGEVPPSDQTTCAYSCSISLRGAAAEHPYGASKEYELDYNLPYKPGDVPGVVTMCHIAQENGDLHTNDGYAPKAGDIIVVDDNKNPPWNDFGDHVAMVTETGGFIYGGGTSSWWKRQERTSSQGYGAITETNHNCLDMVNWDGRYVIAVIETSKYSNGAGLEGVAGSFTGTYQAGAAKSKAALLNNKVDWGLEHLATIGDGLNDMIEQFTILADNVLSEMKNIGVATIASLIIIDFTSFLLLNGFIFPISIFLAKLLKYCFLLFVFLNWDVIVNFIFLDFTQSTSAVLAGESTSAHLTQPHFLLSKGVEAVSPALNFISTAKGLTDISNWPMLAFLVIVTFGTMAFMIASAIYIAYIFIEFYLVAAFNAVFMIFPTLRFTKFIAENGLGSMIKSTIKLFVAACLVYIIAGYVEEANFAITWPSDVNSLADGTLRKYLFLCGNICFFVWMILRIPGRIADIYGGKIDLPG